jgi:GNAT superfamily N-acetyltransferase
MSVWKKIRQHDLLKAEDFLREREPYCVSAISRFRGGTANIVWGAFSRHADSGAAALRALLLYHKRLVFPVFHFPESQRDEFKTNGMPLPFLSPSLLKRDSLHAAQGLADDMDMLERALEKKGIVSSSKYEYDLLSLDYGGEVFAIKTLPGLVIRRAQPADAGALFPLQAAYEMEEVIPAGAEFNPAVCRRSLEILVANNMTLKAELEGVTVGKININARSYKRFQIGGVYVLPEYRNLGIARSLTAALIRETAPYKNYFSLFVKKANTPARRVYNSLGFTKSADYRITYFV